LKGESDDDDECECDSDFFGEFDDDLVW